MTPLETLLLSLIFDESVDTDGAYFHSWCGPSDTLTLDVDDLRQTWDESRSIDCVINGYVTILLREWDAASDADRSGEIDVDLTGPGPGWVEMLQEIVRRSRSVDEIVVAAAFICSKMRPDGFGGSLMRITAGAVQYGSTVEMLETMRNGPAVQSLSGGDGRDTLGRLETIAGAAGWDSFTLLLLIAPAQLKRSTLPSR
jgi:hypothetical protein